MKAAGVLVATLLVACGAPEGERSTSVTIIDEATHSESDGLALSNDGRFAAVTYSGLPSQTLMAIDINRAIVTLLRTRAGDLVYDPMFSPDSDHLIFATRGLEQPYQLEAASKLWRYEMSGRVRGVKLLDSTARVFRFPVSANDGNIIYYFGSLGLGVVDRTRYQVFRLQTSSGSVSAVGDATFSAPRGLFITDECIIADATLEETLSSKDEKIADVIRRGLSGAAPSANDTYCLSRTTGKTQRAIPRDFDGAGHRLKYVRADGTLILSKTGTRELVEVNESKRPATIMVTEPFAGLALGSLVVANEQRYARVVVEAGTPTLVVRTSKGEAKIPISPSELIDGPIVHF